MFDLNVNLGYNGERGKMLCSQLISSCPKREKCSISKQILFKDIWELYQMDKMPCSVDFVYLNQSSDGEVRDQVFAKRMVGDCYYLFMTKGNYLYIFGGGLLASILVWARDPREFSRKGYLGNHTSIGLRKNGTIDIHTTLYSICCSSTNEPMISRKNKKVIPYRLLKNNEIRKVNPSDNDSGDTTEEFWNEMLCVLDDPNLLQSGGYTPDNIFYDPLSYHIFPIQKTRSKLDSTYEKMKRDIALVIDEIKGSGRIGIIPISYVAPHETEAFLRYMRTPENVIMIRDKYYKSCALLVQFDLM